MELRKFLSNVNFPATHAASLYLILVDKQFHFPNGAEWDVNNKQSELHKGKQATL